MKFILTSLIFIIFSFSLISKTDDKLIFKYDFLNDTIRITNKSRVNSRNSVIEESNIPKCYEIYSWYYPENVIGKDYVGGDYVSSKSQLSIEVYEDKIILHKAKKNRIVPLNENNRIILVEDIYKLEENLKKGGYCLFLSITRQKEDIKSKFGIVNVNGYEYFVDYNEKFDPQYEDLYEEMNQQVDKIIKDIEKIFNQKDILRDLLIDKPTTSKKKGTQNDKT